MRRGGGGRQPGGAKKGDSGTVAVVVPSSFRAGDRERGGSRCSRKDMFERLKPGTTKDACDEGSMEGQQDCPMTLIMIHGDR